MTTPPLERLAPGVRCDPGDEPPPGVSGEMLWRVAVRLHRDHGIVWVDEAEIVPRPRCRRCGEPWPCSGRRLAELGLLTAGG